jgi:hypothetical protein
MCVAGNASVLTLHAYWLEKDVPFLAAICPCLPSLPVQCGPRCPAKHSGVNQLLCPSNHADTTEDDGYFKCTRFHPNTWLQRCRSCASGLGRNRRRARERSTLRLNFMLPQGVCTAWRDVAMSTPLLWTTTRLPRVLRQRITVDAFDHIVRCVFSSLAPSIVRARMHSHPSLSLSPFFSNCLCDFPPLPACPSASVSPAPPPQTSPKSQHLRKCRSCSQLGLKEMDLRGVAHVGLADAATRGERLQVWTAYNPFPPPSPSQTNFPLVFQAMCTMPCLTAKRATNVLRGLLLFFLTITMTGARGPPPQLGGARKVNPEGPPHVPRIPDTPDARPQGVCACR